MKIVYNRTDSSYFKATISLTSTLSIRPKLYKSWKKSYTKFQVIRHIEIGFSWMFINNLTLALHLESRPIPCGHCVDGNTSGDWLYHVTCDKCGGYGYKKLKE